MNLNVTVKNNFLGCFALFFFLSYSSIWHHYPWWEFPHCERSIRVVANTTLFSNLCVKQCSWNMKYPGIYSQEIVP